MKLILNDNLEQEIYIDSFYRELDITNIEVLFNISFSNGNMNHVAEMQYLVQYDKTPITSYQILSNNDEVLLDVTNCGAKLTSFNEQFDDNFYSAHATIQHFEPVISD